MQYCRRPRCRRLQLEPLDDRCLLSGYGQSQIAGYTPAEIAGVYGLNAITFTSSSGSMVNGNGKGETIALIEEYHDPNIRSDLNTFDRANNLPNPSLTVVNQAGSKTNNSWALEESMDVEWAHAIAPGANILVVEAAPANSQAKELHNQLNAENTARKTPGVVAISMSWGFMEKSSETSDDSYFTTPAGHTGITFIASSGDYGFAWYPSTSPNVLSVGGTSLFLTSSGSYESETAWFWSGGAYSPYEPEPSYQSSVQATGQRSTPDVSFDANPSTGVAIYETPPRSGKGSWQVYGGTSLGAPAWAGIIAIVDEGRALEGKGRVDGPTQTLPSLYALPASDFKSMSPYDGFLDSGGLSSLLGDVFGSDSNSATANTATGLGSPNGPSLIEDLVASTVTTKPPIKSESGPSGRALSPSSLTHPTKRTGSGSTHHQIDHHGRTLRRTTAHSLTVAGRRVVAVGSRTEK